MGKLAYMNPPEPQARASRAPSDAELKVLVRDYLFLERISEAQQRAFDSVVELVIEAPNDCWRMICLAAQMDLSIEQAAYFAAGPLEDLLGRHGDRFIDRLEVAVRREPGMRTLMAGVWRGDMIDAVWARVQSLRATLGIEPL